MTRIQLRRDTSERFNSINPILAEGEPAYETDTKKRKIGDGTTTYTELPYLDTGGGSEYTLPIASADTLGGVKVGSGLSIDTDGTLSATGGGGGEGGTTNYSNLTNKPQINGNTLEGNLTTEQLGIDIPDVSGLVTNEELTNATQDLVSNTALTTKLNDYPTKTELTSGLETKQDKLTAGTGIEIVENTINATLDTSNLFELDVDGQKVTGAYSEFNQLLITDDTTEGVDNAGYIAKLDGQLNIVSNFGSNLGLCLTNEVFSVGSVYSTEQGGHNINIVGDEYLKIDTTDYIFKMRIGEEGSEYVKLEDDTNNFLKPVKIGVKGTPTNLYVQSEQQISRATADGGLFYTVESEINGTKIKSLSQSDYDGLSGKDKNTIYMIEGGSPADSKDPIGRPIFTLDNLLYGDEIWLEGATVSRTTYAKLFAIYGTTYGEGDGSTTFALPDFRNRTIWGTDEAGGFGYIEAGLPNITGSIIAYAYTENGGWANNATGALTGKVASSGSALSSGKYAGGMEISIDASRSNAVYNNDVITVQPPAVKVRVKTRYK